MGASPMRTVDRRSALRGVTPVLPVLLAVGLALAALHSRGDDERPTAPPDRSQRANERAEPANWAPAMLTFVVGVEVWGTTGVGERPHWLLYQDWGLARVESPTEIESIQWSPDGKRLVYMADMSLYEPPSIWQATYSTADDMTGSPECLCPVGFRPRLSPDGTLIAVNRPANVDHLAVSDPRLIVMRLGQPGADRVTTDYTPLLERYLSPMFRVEHMDVAWSPSGRVLATPWLPLVLIDLDNHAAREVDCGAVPSHPQWSPDGVHLAFAADPHEGPGSQSDIYAIQPDGTGLTNLTNDPREDERPMWSPEGRLIAFLRRQPEVNREDGPETPRPTSGEALSQPFPLPPRYYYAIWVMNADGTDQRQLTPEVGTDEDPAWSPDGRWIAYKTEEFPPDEDRLWVVGIDGSAPQEVAADLHGIGARAWRPGMVPTSEKGE